MTAYLSDEQERLVLGEVLMDKLQAIEELVTDVPVISQRLGRVEERLDHLEDDMKIVRVVVTDMPKESRGHDRRLFRIEDHLSISGAA